MTKYLSLILATHLTGATIISNPTINNFIVKEINNLTSNRALYKNIDSNFLNYGADVNQANAGANNQHTGSYGTIFNWSDYANSWDEFKNNYSGLNLTINMNIAFNWYNVKWSTSSLYVPLSNITVGGTNWVEIHEELQTTTQGSRWDGCHARLDYDCWVSGNNLLIRFQLKTWATNNYDNYYYNIDTRHITCNSTFNYNTIYSKLNQSVNNHNFNLDSDYSTSLQDNRNWPLINQNIQQLVQTALGSYYDAWKTIIFPNSTSPYTYNDSTGQVTLTISFIDPNTNKQNRWYINVGVSLNLSGEYWTKTLKERLQITPGQVVDPSGAMVDDKPFTWAGKSVYGTTAFIMFTGNPDESETMKVNGQELQVINHKFSYDMTDHQDHNDSKGNPTNEYNILLEKHDLNDWNHILGSYSVDYAIMQNVPNLQLKWHAWDPDNNQFQKDLITPTLPDGSPNPKYDREVNPKTGTKAQILWIKNKAETPFPLDPLDQNGNRRDDNFDKGFIAEGSVSGMGIERNYSDSWIKSVSQEEVNPNDLSQKTSPIDIKTDGQGSYFSPSGTYHYTITDQKGFTAHKFIIIGQDYQNKYAKFLDVLNNPSIAIDFWISLEGQHLKYYLMNSKHLDSRAMQNLNFEQVSSYWKEYVSDIRSQYVPNPPTPGDIINLDNIQLELIKMHASDIKTIKNNIINGYSDPNYDMKGIIAQLQKLGLEKDVDYQINDLDDSNLEQLLNFDNTDKLSISISISALPTSTKAAGTTRVKVTNLKDSLDDAVDLSKIKFDDYQFNFSKFTTKKLREWILKGVTKGLAGNPNQVKLVYQTDYDVNPLDENTLQNFIKSKTRYSLLISIQSLDTNKAVNSTSLTIINDPNADPAPPDPPDPKPPIPINPIPPNPIPNPTWFSQGKNLAWFLPVIIIGSGGLITFFFWYKYRRNKKIK